MMDEKKLRKRRKDKPNRKGWRRVYMTREEACNLMGLMNESGIDAGTTALYEHEAGADPTDGTVIGYEVQVNTASLRTPELLRHLARHVEAVGGNLHTGSLGSMSVR